MQGRYYTIHPDFCVMEITKEKVTTLKGRDRYLLEPFHTKDNTAMTIILLKQFLDFLHVPFSENELPFKF